MHVMNLAKAIPNDLVARVQKQSFIVKVKLQTPYSLQYRIMF